MTQSVSVKVVNNESTKRLKKYKTIQTKKNKQQLTFAETSNMLIKYCSTNFGCKTKTTKLKQVNFN